MTTTMTPRIGGHGAQVPTVVQEYVERHVHPDPLDQEHPIVSHVFTPGKGWRQYPIHKRISGNWARQARREGITHVALSAYGRTIDFRIEELTR